MKLMLEAVTVDDINKSRVEVDDCGSLRPTFAIAHSILVRIYTLPRQLLKRWTRAATRVVDGRDRTAKARPCIQWRYSMPFTPIAKDLTSWT